MKKMLFIPLDYMHNPYQELYESFCKKFDTMYFKDLNSAILFNPDYIYCHSMAISPNDLSLIKNECNSFVIQWTGNVRDYVLPEVEAYKDVCDLTLLASGIAQKEMYEKVLKHPVRYLQHHVSNWQFIEAKNVENTEKIIFIGNAYDQFEGALERNELCAILTSEFEQFEVWGNGFKLPQYRNPDSILFSETQPMYNNAYISISANCFNNLEGYYSDRPLHIMAAGGCCLMRYVPSLENLFTDMDHCVFYRSNDEAVEKIKYLINNPETRNRIAKSGQDHVLKFHCNDFRILEIIEYLKEFNK